MTLLSDVVAWFDAVWRRAFVENPVTALVGYFVFVVLVGLLCARFIRVGKGPAR